MRSRTENFANHLLFCLFAKRSQSKDLIHWLKLLVKFFRLLRKGRGYFEIEARLFQIFDFIVNTFVNIVPLLFKISL